LFLETLLLAAELLIVWLSYYYLLAPPANAVFATSLSM
jgi:hypothetical protein